MHKTSILFSLLFTMCIAKAQTLVKSGDFHSEYSYYSSETSNNKININSVLPISGVMIKAKIGNTFENVILITQKDTIEFNQDHHNETSINEIASQLVTLSTETSNIALSLASLRDTIKIYLIHQSHGEAISIISHSGLRISSEAPCSEPDAIPQSVWRNTPTALPAPTVMPTETEVQHVIIHHAAGSNTETNYMSVVRSYYILHTEINGWDDIGYNFLVAQDGTIFTGRDSQGYFDHDNVRGAHMCGKNNNTMAICLLGNYQSVEPPTVMMDAMKRIVAWKIHKENIDPLGNSIHGIGPVNANLPDASLAHIAGHREGCSTGYTVCPGTYVFEQMDDIRNDVDYMINNECEIPQSIMENEPEQIKLTIQDRTVKIETKSALNELTIYYPDGKIAYKHPVQNQQKIIIDLNSWQNGMYILSGYNQTGILSEKMILY